MDQGKKRLVQDTINIHCSQVHKHHFFFFFINKVQNMGWYKMATKHK